MRPRFNDVPIQRKLMLLIFLTSLVAMLLMRGTFFIYEFVAFRQATVRQLSTLGEVLANNSTAALAFQNQDDAREILSALKAERYLAGAALYDRNGVIFATYPANAPAASFPAGPGDDGFRFEPSHLAGFEPVVQRGKRLGTLYLKYETGTIMAEWLRVSLGIALAVIAVISLVTLGLSRFLQRQISRPILSLAQTAQAVTEHRDYSVRAPKLGGDEVGRLTDAFNQMLAELEKIHRELEQRVRERTAQLATAHDELRREQARLQFILDTMPVGLSFTVTQPDGTVTRLLNDAHLRICGLTREQVRAQADFNRITHPDDQERQGALVRDLEAGKIDSFTLDKRYARPDGQIVWVILTAQRRTLNDGTREDLSIVVDITPRKRTEEALRLANEKLEAQTTQLAATNAELEAFSYSVSHDLRAPLRHVHGFATLLDKHAAAVLDDKGRRFLATIAGAARQMGQLIDDLLAFSRVGRTSLVPAEVDHDMLVATVIREGRYDADGHQLAWDISALPGVRADLAMLRQVWANLLGNAVKYSAKAAQPRVVVRGTIDAAAGEAVFSVADNGVGFDMAYAGKLFGVFQRLHGPAEFEGTGIGLANVRRIVTRHGGRTWAEGRVGEGATFFFSLPVVKIDGDLAAGSITPASA